MTRRRTSVIGGSRGPTFSATSAPSPTAQRQWTLQAVRELVLSNNLDELQESQAWEETARRWRIATGRDTGNPAPTGQRSTVVREKPVNGVTWWRKDYGADFGELQRNESDVLKRLAEADPAGQARLRDHVAHFDQRASGTRLAHASVRTKDAGPNLDMWHDFAPCASVGASSLPLPLFAQPLFLAALTRQVLIALHKLAQLDFVHGDIKPANLCLAFPADYRATRATASGQWDLRALPLRLIDFETAFGPIVHRLAFEGHNPNWSPYLLACFRRARAEPSLHRRQGLLHGIDWGCDLWALGHTLTDWCYSAQDFLSAFSAATAEHWGIDSPAHRSAQDTVSPFLKDLGFLRSFAGELKTREQAEADAQAEAPEPRLDPPHSQLWTKLENYFQLGPGDGDRRVRFTLIVPTQPLAAATGSSWADRAALRTRAAAGAATAWARQQRSIWADRAALRTRAAAGAATAWAKQQRRPLLAAMAAASLATGAVIGRGAMATALAPTVVELTQASLMARVDANNPWRAALAPALLHLSGLLDGSLPSRVIAAALRPTEELVTIRGGITADINPVVLKTVRDVNLRALDLLADAPDAALYATDSGADGLLGHRLLLQAFQSGRQLEAQAGRGQPPAAPDAHTAALARLHQRTGWPMAALLQLHLSSCYGTRASRQPAALRPVVESLLALDRQQPAHRDFYIPSAQGFAQRLAAGQDPCTLPASLPA